jgi:hypothetical protein
VCRSLALRPLVTSSWWLNKRWMFPSSSRFNYYAKIQQFYAISKQSEQKISPKPVHFFSASDKETDTNNMHLQRHVDEGRRRYETYPHLPPRSGARNWDCQTPTTGKACRVLPKLLTMGYFESTSSTLQNAGDYILIWGVATKEKRLFFLLHNINTIETQAKSAIEREMLRCNLLAISTCGIHTAQLAQFSVVFIAMSHPWRWSNEIY